MSKIDVCASCFERTDIVPRSEYHGEHTCQSGCCGAGLYTLPEVIYDFYKPDLKRIMQGRKSIQISGSDARRLEVIEDAWSEYKNKETYNEYWHQVHS